MELDRFYEEIVSILQSAFKLKNGAFGVDGHVFLLMTEQEEEGFYSCLPEHHFLPSNSSAMLL